MSTKKEKKEKKEKKRLSRSAIVLIVGLIIIAIPVCIFLGILGVSYLQTGTPREGSRFDGDLEPAITEENLSSIKDKLSQLSSVEEIEVVLSEGQLRIFIDTEDTLSEAQVDSLLTSAYNTVNGELPISIYFTATESKKMYDLQINVYTSPEASEIDAASSRQYKLLHKNSAEETYGIDDLAHPKDPALAAELEGRTPSEQTDTGEEADEEYEEEYTEE